MRSEISKRIEETTPKDSKIFARKYAEIILRVNDILSLKNINRKSLAERLDKKPSEISKWLTGEHNFTLRSIAKLEAELGEDIIYIPKRKVYSVGSTPVHLTVYKNCNPEKKADKSLFETTEFIPVVNG